MPETPKVIEQPINQSLRGSTPPVLTDTLSKSKGFGEGREGSIS